jgi:hypothetical protein
VIGGFTDPKGSRHGFGALLLGYWQGGGDLVYAGKVGTGFDHELLEGLRRRLASLEQDRQPFSTGRLPRARGCTGCGRSWSPRSASANGRVTGSCAIPGSWGSGATSARARWYGSDRDERQADGAGRPADRRGLQPRQGAVPRRRHHQGRPGRLLRAGGPVDAAVPAGAPRRHGALPGRDRRPADLPEGRARLLPRLDRSGQGREGGRRAAAGRLRRRRHAGVPGQPGLHYPARLAVAGRPARPPRPAHLRPRPRKGLRGGAGGRPCGCGRCWRSWSCRRSPRRPAARAST